MAFDCINHNILLAKMVFYGIMGKAQANLTAYQKGAYYSGINIFNNLLLEIKNVAGNQNKFRIALKIFLHTY